MVSNGSVVVGVLGPPTSARWRAALEGAGFTIAAVVVDDAGLRRASRDESVRLAVIEVGFGQNWLLAVTTMARRTATPVVVVDASYSDVDFLGALRAGARSYVSATATATLASLADAARAALRGETVLAPALVGRLVAEVNNCTGHRDLGFAEGGDVVSLTMREWEIFSLVRQGASTTEIAIGAFISKATVRSHIAAIAHKLRVRGREEIIVWDPHVPIASA